MMNALTYLTRGCLRKCTYCAFRDARDVGPELSIQEWIRAFEILEEIRIEFNLILGNETWLLGTKLVDLFKNNSIPYALYTTCPPTLFHKYKDKLLGDGIIDNLSCGVDYPMLEEPVQDDSYWKSVDAWKGLAHAMNTYSGLDCQGTVTVHRMNYQYLPQIVNGLAALGVFCGINFIHWDSDGGFDFFPNKDILRDYLFKDTDLPRLREVLDQVLEKPQLVQNPEMLKLDTEILTQMGWHCGGNPYGGPTIDADGSLRVCGYRKGTRTSEFSIFDLPDRLQDWEMAVFEDAMECPGCCWSYPWMYHYWMKQDSKMGRAIFANHAGRHIPKETWSKRKGDFL